MPREIIDTQSSRPQYIRRRVAQTVAVVLVLLAIFVALVFTGVIHLHPVHAEVLVTPVIQGNSGR